MHWRLVLLLAPLLVACSSPPPTLDDIPYLRHVEDVGTRVYFRAPERAAAEAALPQVAAVRSEVHARLGFAPPRAEVVIYAPKGAAWHGHHMRETHCDLVLDASGWRIRFVYPFGGAPGSLSQLLGTTAHEVAEATVLVQVTVIDPYLRWMHDGIAELVEHEVLGRLAPDAARASLRRTIEFVRERRDDGVAWADLSRWRQLAPWIVRSHRFLGPDERNLALDDVEGSRRRVGAALERTDDPVLARGLEELDAMLVRHQARERAPWAPGEARIDDPRTLDLLYYNLSFAYWLSLERAQPGSLRRFVKALATRRAGGDHILSADEAVVLLRDAAQGFELPALDRFTLEQAEDILRAEEDLLLQTGR